MTKWPSNADAKRLLDRPNREAGLKALDLRGFKAHDPQNPQIRKATGGHEIFNRSHADLETPCDFLLREQAGICGVCFFHAGWLLTLHLCANPAVLSNPLIKPKLETLPARPGNSLSLQARGEHLLFPACATQV
jgi:hypothetical protein